MALDFEFKFFEKYKTEIYIGKYGDTPVSDDCFIYGIIKEFKKIQHLKTT